MVVAAHDVPDQADNKVRYVQEYSDVTFDPPLDDLPAPTIYLEDMEELDGDWDGNIWTSESSHELRGFVQSNAGEVKSLQFKLYGDVGEPRIYRFDATFFSLMGDFSTNLELVSDWSRLDRRNGPTTVSNELEITAKDVRGRETTVKYHYHFTPPLETNEPPELTLITTFPPEDSTGVAWVPTKGLLRQQREGYRLWGAAADDLGATGRLLPDVRMRPPGLHGGKPPPQPVPLLRQGDREAGPGRRGAFPGRALGIR